MLMLSRKVDQQIAIGKDILITVLEIVGNRVKIGIAAPDSQQILRSELAVQRPLATDNHRSRRPKVSTD